MNENISFLQVSSCSTVPWCISVDSACLHGHRAALRKSLLCAHSCLLTSLWGLWEVLLCIPWSVWLCVCVCQLLYLYSLSMCVYILKPLVVWASPVNIAVPNMSHKQRPPQIPHYTVQNSETNLNLTLNIAKLNSWFKDTLWKTGGGDKEVRKVLRTTSGNNCFQRSPQQPLKAPSLPFHHVKDQKENFIHPSTSFCLSLTILLYCPWASWGLD